MKAACLRLSPGDTLRVLPGTYFVDGSRIFVRYVNPETRAWSPLRATKDAPVRIMASGRGPHVIEGYFDVRGSHIMIRGLTIVGDPSLAKAGIGVFESHDVSIRDCCLVNHGASGIQFAQCDLMSAIGNVLAFNSTTDPGQTSGLSSYQAMVRTDSKAPIGLDVRNNISIGNKNLVPNTRGQITDGNGIIIDDHRYTQNNSRVEDALSGNERPDGAGVATIDSDQEGRPVPYQRQTRISGNVCFLNGGKGVHVYRSDTVSISNNFCFLNLQSPVFTEGLTRDENGNPTYFNGEFSVVDSRFVDVSWNLGLAFNPEQAAAAELFFSGYRPADGISPNSWFGNCFVNLRLGPNVFTFGSDVSSLSR